MGLTSWKNSPDGLIYKYDVGIAKNYLQKEELEKLNDLTNLFLDVAETEAKEQKTMTMSKWIDVADDLLKYRKKNILLKKMIEYEVRVCHIVLDILIIN